MVRGICFVGLGCVRGEDFRVRSVLALEWLDWEVCEKLEHCALVLEAVPFREVALEKCSSRLW